MEEVGTERPILLAHVSSNILQRLMEEVGTERPILLDHVSTGCYQILHLPFTA
jgi:hypothetical protein